ncbi:30S ribosomal protein S1 [Fusibacter sp. 3D3]|uniref:30S ribosomal protein S1 n=1 Tax=Fusibacter sp. 3D3 TaxID=1048380 RepID=UPI000852F32B|nr:30S ribosomal protein S1 [Fusibacter sp. 3D3]GAU78006.1 small subunit ribosomal protein S1p [Fusibacter sp. 3D3]
MSDSMSMADLMAQYETNNDLKKGDVIEGTILSVNTEEVIVNINYSSDGVLPKEEITGSTTEGLEVNQKISVFVLKADNGDGNVLLSQKKADQILVWDEFEKIMNSKRPFKVKVKEVVTGGLVADYKGARVFIPASHVALAYVEDLKPYLHQTLEIVLIDYKKEDQKVVGSRKVIEQEAQERSKADRLSRISPDDRITGKVVRIADYGAFVDLGGVDGLVHISQMSNKRIKHPSEVVQEGALVEVIVLEVNREKERISLKLADIKESPWETVDVHYHVDDVVAGKVTRIMNFGAFVEIEDGLEGLIHISELSEQHVSRVQEVVNVGDEIEVMIIQIDSENQKMGLSLKAAKEAELSDFEPYAEEEQTTTLSDLFGDKLKNLKF